MVLFGYRFLRYLGPGTGASSTYLVWNTGTHRLSSPWTSTLFLPSGKEFRRRDRSGTQGNVLHCPKARHHHRNNLSIPNKILWPTGTNQRNCQAFPRQPKMSHSQRRVTTTRDWANIEPEFVLNSTNEEWLATQYRKRQYGLLTIGVFSLSIVPMKLSDSWKRTGEALWYTMEESNAYEKTPNWVVLVFMLWR